MLLTMVDVLCCENPGCREFARIVHVAPGIRSYYCPVCGGISRSRPVDAALADSPERFAAYLRECVDSMREPAGIK